MARRLDWNSVRLVKAKRSNKWVAEFHQDGKRKQLSTGFEDRSWAERWVESEIFKGQPELTVGECLSRYEEDVVLQSNTEQSGWPSTKQTLLDHFDEARPVSMLKATDYTQYAKFCAQGRYSRRPLAKSTIALRLRLLKAAVNHSLKMGYLEPGSAPSPVIMPDYQHKEKRTITIKEWRRLVEIAQEQERRDIEAYLVIVGNTGARAKVILDLEWRQVNMQAKVINFQKPERPKTKKKNASAPMSNGLFEFLKTRAGRDPHDLVVQPNLQIPTLNKWLEKHAPAETTSHVMRHSYITWQCMAGTPIYLISQITGNSVKMIETVYAHFNPEDSAARQAANALAAK
jgi:integrase